jgi:hypothetical protein
MTTIKDIIQVGVGMPDRQAFAQFSHDILGLPTTESPDGKVTYLRADVFRHRIAARTAPAPTINYIGFDLGGPDALAEWKTTLTAKGLALRQAAARNVANGRWLTSSSSKIPMVIRWPYRMASRATMSL